MSGLSIFNARDGHRLAGSNEHDGVSAHERRAGRLQRNQDLYRGWLDRRSARPDKKQERSKRVLLSGMPWPHTCVLRPKGL